MTMPETLQPDELVERLRGYRPTNEWGDTVNHTICDEAAGRILAIQSDLERVTAERDAAKAEIELAKDDLRSFMTTFVREHFPDVPQWRPLPDLMGMLSQMDNASTIARDLSARATTAEAALVKARTAETWTWFELREPRCVPERKGPVPPAMVADFLRDIFKHRPKAYVTVITMGQDGPLLQDGPECLQMLDGRSMSTGRKHNASSFEAHSAARLALSAGEEAK